MTRKSREGFDIYLHRLVDEGVLVRELEGGPMLDDEEIHIHPDFLEKCKANSLRFLEDRGYSIDSEEEIDDIMRGPIILAYLQTRRDNALPRREIIDAAKVVYNIIKTTRKETLREWSMNLRTYGGK